MDDYKADLFDRTHAPTIDNHVRRNLPNLLSRSSPCELCSTLWWFSELDCLVCRAFVGLPPFLQRCPCQVLGKEAAIRRTWLALEDYLDEDDPFWDDTTIGVLLNASATI